MAKLISFQPIALIKGNTQKGKILVSQVLSHILKQIKTNPIYLSLKEPLQKEHFLQVSDLTVLLILEMLF